jgi:hypothetical protein
MVVNDLVVDFFVKLSHSQVVVAVLMRDLTLAVFIMAGDCILFAALFATVFMGGLLEWTLELKPREKIIRLVTSVWNKFLLTVV